MERESRNRTESTPKIEEEKKGKGTRKTEQGNSDGKGEGKRYGT